MNEKGFVPAPVMTEGGAYDLISGRRLTQEDRDKWVKEREEERKKLDAYQELMEYMEEGEVVEAIVFGKWGWDGYREPKDIPIQKDMQGIVLTPEQAKPLMKGWTFHCGHGAPQSYAVNIWTNKRVFWVTQYDGATTLDSAPRNPTAYIPEMPGG